MNKYGRSVRGEEKIVLTEEDFVAIGRDLPKGWAVRLEQRSGDKISIPVGWMHQVVNCEPCIKVAYDLCLPERIPFYLKALRFISRNTAFEVNGESVLPPDYAGTVQQIVNTASTENNYEALEKVMQKEPSNSAANVGDNERPIVDVAPKSVGTRAPGMDPTADDDPYIHHRKLRSRPIAVSTVENAFTPGSIVAPAVAVSGGGASTATTPPPRSFVPDVADVFSSGMRLRNKAISSPPIEKRIPLGGRISSVAADVAAPSQHTPPNHGGAFPPNAVDALPFRIQISSPLLDIDSVRGKIQR